MGPTLVAMATKFGLGAEIQSPIGLSILMFCFRRCLLIFCPDGDMEWEEEMAYPSYSRPANDDAVDFDYLLYQAQRNLRYK